MAVEGVSGEIATPAFMFFPCMVLMREIASASHSGVQPKDIPGDRRSVSRLTRCFYVETVEFTPSIRDSVYPLRVGVLMHLDRWGLGGHPTCSGLETIMWQSMKIPGTPLATHSSTGAPVWGFSGFVDRTDREERLDVPIVMLGTK